MHESIVEIILLLVNQYNSVFIWNLTCLFLALTTGHTLCCTSGSYRESTEKYVAASSLICLAGSFQFGWYQVSSYWNHTFLAWAEIRVAISRCFGCMLIILYTYFILEIKPWHRNLRLSHFPINQRFFFFFRSVQGGRAATDGTSCASRWAGWT